MRDEYRRLKFGCCPADWRQPQVEASEQILLSYLKTSKGFGLTRDVPATLEIFGIAKQFVGKNFQSWLIANFNNGSGARAPLVRAIVAWSKGKISSRYLIGELRRDLGRIDFIPPAELQLAQPIIFNDHPTNGEETLSFAGVVDRHFFEMIGVFGPELTAHLLLSLNGIRYKK